MSAFLHKFPAAQQEKTTTFQTQRRRFEDQCLAQGHFDMWTTEKLKWPLKNWIHPSTSSHGYCKSAVLVKKRSQKVPEFPLVFMIFQTLVKHLDLLMLTSQLREQLWSSEWIFTFSLLCLRSVVRAHLHRTEEFFEVQREHLRASVPVCSLPGITVAWESLPTEEAVRNV